MGPSSIKEAVNIIEGKVDGTGYIWSSGVFLEAYNRYKTYISEKKNKTDIENELKKANEKIKKLEGKLTEKKAKVKINITNYMIPDIYRGVKMNPFGKEDFTNYSLQDMLSVIENMKHPLGEGDYEIIFKKLVELIHYDKRFPQNHNIHITVNNKTPKCIMYTDSGWDMSIDLSMVVKKLFSINYEFMKQTYIKYQSRCDSLDDTTTYLLRLVYEKMKDYKSSKTELIGNTLYTLTKSKIGYMTRDSR